MLDQVTNKISVRIPVSFNYVCETTFLLSFYIVPMVRRSRPNIVMQNKTSPWRHGMPSFLPRCRLLDTTKQAGVNPARFISVHGKMSNVPIEDPDYHTLLSLITMVSRGQTITVVPARALLCIPHVSPSEISVLVLVLGLYHGEKSVGGEDQYKDQHAALFIVDSINLYVKISSA